MLPLLEEVLGGGVAEALARTATALREDTDTLDELAQRALAERRHRRAVWTPPGWPRCRRPSGAG